MRYGRSFLSPPVVVLSAGVAAGCGPSAQSIYEGDVRFEHCYRLDLELDVAQTHRQACWTSWLSRYTYGQSRDRLEYARRRVRAFEGNDLEHPVLRVGENQVQRDTRQFYLVVPAPTSVHAPPPPIATRMNVVTELPPVSPHVAPKSESRATPGGECASACLAAFDSCNEACDATTKNTACKSCDPDYRQCMQRCFD